MTHNVKIYLNGNWIPARDYQANAFYEFQNQWLDDEFIYDNNLEGNKKIKFSIKREQDQRVFLTKEDGTKIPIADWDDVQVFILDHPSNIVDWYEARNYQTWAYFDFIYSSCNEKYYKTKNSTDLIHGINYTEIPIENLHSDIVFRISRTSYRNIFLEKNNFERTKTRISDNNIQRHSYSCFYDRLTNNDILPFSHYCPQETQSQTQIFIPDVFVEETDDDSLMCIVCNTNKKNIKLSCNHDLTCSECCKELLKLQGYVKCPLCRIISVSIKKIE